MTKMTFIFDTGSSVRESEIVLIALNLVVLGPKHGLCQLQIFFKTLQYNLIVDVLACRNFLN